jgi:quinol monooxygenase YgiN
MSAFIHAVTMQVKPGKLAEARAEVARMAAAVEAKGAKARLLVSMAGDTSEATLIIEFKSGKAWAKVMQSDVVREARRRRYESDFPFTVSNTSVYQELDINS